jgi:hypothetical protein
MINGEQGIPISLPVRVWGMDLHGRFFDVWSHTADISQAGARIVGMPFPLRRGAIIGVDCGLSRAGFEVSWVGDAGTPLQGQVHLRCVEPTKCVWGVPLNRTVGAGSE